MSRPLDVNANENTFGLHVVKDIAGETGENQSGQSVDTGHQSVTSTALRGLSNVIVPSRPLDIVFHTASVGRTTETGHPTALQGYSALSGHPALTGLSTQSARSSQTGHFQAGPESHPVLCSESAPLSDDAHRSSQFDYDGTGLPQTFNQDSAHYGDKTRRQLLLSNKETGRDKLRVASSANSRETLIDSKNSVFSLPGSVSNHISANDIHRSEGNGAHLDRRMNTNGIDRSAMTGSSTTTSENISWLTAREPGTPCQSQGTRAAPNTILTSDTHHLMHLQTPGSIFRPPLTDHSSRLYPGQYAPIYTTTGTSLPPYSPTPLYAPNVQSSQLGPLSPYNPFYQYPHAATGYPTAALLPSGSPHYSGPEPLQTYSAVLANLTREHHAQSQLPRPYPHTLLPHQYPGTLTPTNSPGPVPRRAPTPSQIPLTSTAGVSLHPQLADPGHKSPMQEHKEGGRMIRPLGSPPRVEAKSRLSPTPHQYKHMLHSSVKDSPLHEGKDMSGFKYPSGSGSKDSPRKPKYQVRPPEHPGEGQAIGNVKSHYGHYKSEEPSPKRHRMSEGGIGNPPPLHSVHPSSIPHTSASGSSGGPSLPPPPPLQPSYPSQPHYPPHFMKGSIIQLANGELKRVEDLRTDDFVNSADISPDLKIDSSTVVRIEQSPERGTAILGFSVGEQRIQVTVEATLEHPFFVFGQGWSSCSPERTAQRYGLQCHKLSVGDVCISLTHKESDSQSSAPSSQHAPQASRPPNQISDSGTLVARSGGVQSGKSGVEGGRSEGHTASTATSGGESQSQAGREAFTSPQSTPLSSPASTQTRKRRWSAPDQLSVSPTLQAGSSQQPSTSTTTTIKQEGKSDTKTKSTRDDNQGQNT